MVIIRIFLGVFFLYGASAKVVIFDNLFAGDTGQPYAAIQPTPPGGDGAAQQRSADAPPANGEIIAPELFIAEFTKATAPDGPFTGSPAIGRNIWPEYAEFITSMVHPKAELFGWLIIVGEFLVGFLLLIGLLTRLTAAVAMVISAAYLLATMHLFPPMGLLGNAGFLVMELSVLISDAGRVGGFDALLHRPKKKAKEE